MNVEQNVTFKFWVCDPELLADVAQVRGSTIDESRNRQRRPSGMVSWKFDLIMESLPLMLQSALLLLGYALSKYLWAIDLMVASVVIWITSIRLVCYIFIVTAVMTTDNCPFQTPTSQILRSHSVSGLERRVSIVSRPRSFSPHCSPRSRSSGVRRSTNRNGRWPSGYSARRRTTAHITSVQGISSG